MSIYSALKKSVPTVPFFSLVFPPNMCQSRWIPIEGEVLCCVHEPDNTDDIEAVAVKKMPNLDVLGHIP